MSPECCAPCVLYGGFPLGKMCVEGSLLSGCIRVKEAPGVSWVEVPKGGPHPPLPFAFSWGVGMSFPDFLFCFVFLAKLGTLGEISHVFIVVLNERL